MCAATVYEAGGFRRHQCSRKAAEGLKFCKQHDPERIAARHKLRTGHWVEQIRLDKAAQDANALVRQVELELIEAAAFAAPLLGDKLAEVRSIQAEAQRLAVEFRRG